LQAEVYGNSAEASGGAAGVRRSGEMFDTYFEEIEKLYKENPQSALSRLLPEAGTKIVIFGAGVIGGTVLYFLQQNHRPLFAFCDNFKSGIYAGVPILSPHQLAAVHKDAVVIIAVSSKQNCDAMYEQLIGLGFPNCKIIRNYGNVLMDIESLKRNYIDGYKRAYEFFPDEESKSIILNRIKGYLFGFDMECLPLQDIYFHEDIIELSNNEVFIDAGAFDAAISLDFIRRTNGHFKSIYAFEPDYVNYEKMRDNLAPYSNAKAVFAGLWHENGSISFASGNGQGSRVDSNGSSTVPVIALDEYFRDGLSFPTFIKMDIEGSEKSAILGAREIIRMVRPKLAICVYHKPEDIYELPQIISGINSGYRFALRHYTNGIHDTVLYAV